MMRKFPPPKKPMNNASLWFVNLSNYVYDEEMGSKYLLSLQKKTLSLVRVQMASTGTYLGYKIPLTTFFAAQYTTTFLKAVQFRTLSKEAKLKV